VRLCFESGKEVELHIIADFELLHYRQMFGNCCPLQVLVSAQSEFTSGHEPLFECQRADQNQPVVGELGSRG
jgi:hypothetical protein